MKYKNDESKKVLVIEDQVSAMVPIVSILENLKMNVCYVFSYKNFENVILKEKYDYYIIDWTVPPHSGQEIVLLIEKHLQKFYSGSVSKLFIYSGQNLSLSEIPELKRLRYCGHWKKGENIAHLVRQVNRSLNS
ncbi:MAG: hypothetical protein A4S09_03720 [Proteobacteria bacterium SG_bin7]|nr:MAG: hypothetical protein A4S09_03720 [Proteobacteria bacterium SG_bin7]